MSRPTLADIAGYAQVSEATVSRVLNDKPGVATATRQAVLTALDVLGYDRPSRLRRRRSGLVGLIMPELGNPIFPAFAQTIEKSLSSGGYTPVLCTQSPGGAHEDEYVEMLLELGVAGIIYVSGQHADTSTSPQRYLRLRERGLPIVLVNGFIEGVDAPFISNDDRASTELALSHLSDLGHRRIGLAVGQERYVPAQRKIEAYRATMAPVLGEGEAERLIARTLFSVEGGAVAAEILLEQGVSAIVCGSDLMALGAIRAARGRGLVVPDDLSVVGYDDSPLIAFTDPPLTTVRQPVAAMGEAAVRALLEEMGGRTAPRAEYMFHPELVVRGSTSPGPARGQARPSGVSAGSSRPG